MSRCKRDFRFLTSAFISTQSAAFGHSYETHRHSARGHANRTHDLVKEVLEAGG